MTRPNTIETMMAEPELELSKVLMDEFARRTGLDPVKETPTRYLWTDAFAVCVYLDLHRRTGEERYRDLALRLVGQVHAVLGKHRRDDQRRGWISGLSGEEGDRHPTMGGLRIGKMLPERHKHGPVDPMKEWEQDGQYYHYLTKWIHALERVSAVTGEARYLRWAMELARTAHARFSYSLPTGRKRMFWKMSIDLSYPLVTSMGQHDALDGLVTFIELQEATSRFPGEGFPDLATEITELESMAESSSWVTDDPLGAGSLLTDAWRMAQEKHPARERLLLPLLEAGVASLDHVAAGLPVQARAERRLAFRELGLAIGLKASVEMDNAGAAASVEGASELVTQLRAHSSLASQIEGFWSEPHSRSARSWREHEDINAVMLAASLSPGEYLRI